MTLFLRHLCRIFFRSLCCSTGNLSGLNDCTFIPVPCGLVLRGDSVPVFERGRQSYTLNPFMFSVDVSFFPCWNKGGWIETVEFDTLWVCLCLHTNKNKTPKCTVCPLKCSLRKTFYQCNSCVVCVRESQNGGKQKFNILNNQTPRLKAASESHRAIITKWPRAL